MTAPAAGASVPLRILVATSAEAPLEVVEPVCRAIEASGMELCLVDVGKVGSTRRRIERALRGMVGEVAERRLLRGLLTRPPEVAIAFDPFTTQALTAARDGGKSFAPVVAVVPGLDPDSGWAHTDADRYLTFDDSAAVALSDLGVVGHRAIAVGPIGSRRFVEVTRESRTSLRQRFKLATKTVVVCEVGGFEYEAVQQIALQMALAEGDVTALFDCGEDRQAATALRRQVPTLDMRAKLFGRTDDAPQLWRAANVIVARPTLRAVSHALLLGARFVSLSPDGAAQEALAEALARRGVAATARTPLLLAAALGDIEKASGNIKAYAGRSGANIIADIARVVGYDRAGVLAETSEAGDEARRQAAEQEAATEFAADARATAESRVTAAPGGLEDLSGGLFGGEVPAGDELADLTKRAAEASTRVERVKKLVWEARSAAETWDKRAQQADASGRQDLAAQAQERAEAERRTMHGRLRELAELEAEVERLKAASVEAAERARKQEARASATKPPRSSGSPRGGAAAGAPRPPRRSAQDELDSMKRKQSRSLEDELAALKRKMKQK